MNFSFSTPNAPGSGSRILTGLFAPKPTPIDFFEGLCVVVSADLVYGFVAKQSSIALFMPYLALRLPYPMNIASTKGVGLIEGLSFTSTVAGGAVEAQVFLVSRDDSPRVVP